MKQEIKIALFIFFVAMNLVASATMKLSGNFRVRVMGVGPKIKDASECISQELVMNTGRFKVSKSFGEELSFDLAYDLSINYNHINDLNDIDETETQSFKYRAFDLSQNLETNEISSTNILAAEQNLDRVYFTYSTEHFDFYAGRQAVSFGSGRFINPIDVMVPYPLTQIDKEEREGVDALRLKLPISEMGEFDAGIVFGDKGNNKNNAYYLNGKYPVFEWDTSLMIMHFRENLLLGIDLQGEITGAGVWFEGAHVKAHKSDDYDRFSLGVDFNFPIDLYAFMEFHYNGAGSTKTEEYIADELTKPYQDGGVYLLGRDYLTLGLSYNLSPLILFSQNTIVNLNDASFLFSPKVEYNILENHYIDVGMFLGVGKGSRNDQNLKSEFGAYRDSAYVGYKVYF